MGGIAIAHKTGLVNQLPIKLFGLSAIERGWGYYKQENYDRAIADFTQAICLNPNDADAY